MHCDGKITAIIDDLIALGIDVLNLQQPRVLGIEAVGEQFRGQVCFESACDIQHTLPVAEPDDIRAEARLLLQHWAVSNGGFILSLDEDDARSLNFFGKTGLMLEAFLEADPWRRC
jgi:hypothetical protein